MTKDRTTGYTGVDFPLTDILKAELDRRLADLEANLNDVEDWNVVRARLWARAK